MVRGTAQCSDRRGLNVMLHLCGDPGLVRDRCAGEGVMRILRRKSGEEDGCGWGEGEKQYSGSGKERQEEDVNSGITLSVDTGWWLARGCSS
jgi:hypothetical protein